MKRLTCFALILFLWIALTLASLLALAATETGTRWLAQLAVRFVPGELSIGQVHGTLLRRLALEQVCYRLPPHRFELPHLTLTWQPKALFSGHLTIEEITASGLKLKQPAASAAEPAPLTLPAVHLPLAVTIQRAELTDTAIIQGQTRLKLKHVLLNAELMADRFLIHGFRVLIEPWSLSATGEVTLQGEYPLKLAIDWRGKVDGQRLAGQGQLSGDLGELVIEHRLTAPFEAVTLGTMNALDPELPLALHGSWQNLNWPQVTSDYRSPKGSYRVRGSLHAYQLELDAHLAGKTIPALQIHLSGRGDTGSLVLTPLTVHPPKGQLTVTGKVLWEPALTWQLTLKGHNLDPQPFASDWPGRLELTASSSGRWEKPKLVFSLNIEHLRGRLRQQPVEASGTIAFENGQWHSEGLDLRSGANRLSLTGRYGRRIDLSFAVEGRRLSDLWPGLHGTFNAQGRLRGDLSSPQIQAEAQGHGIAWRANRIQKLKMTLRFTPDDPTSRSELSLSQLQLAGLPIERLDLSARGSFDQHRLDLELKAPQGRLITALTGSYRAKVWQVRMKRILLEDKGKRLVFPGDGTVAAEANLDFNARPIALAGKLDLEIPELARLAPWLAPLDRPAGRLSLALRVQGPLTHPQPAGHLKLIGGAAGIQPVGIRLTAINASVAGSGERLDLTGNLRSGEGRLDFSGWAEPPRRLHLTLKGNDLEVVRQTQARIVASPDLVFDLSDRTAHLTGRILLPKADIQLKTLPEGSVTVSEDERIVGAAAKEARKPPLLLTSRVELTLGEQVRFQGFGLTANLSGSLEIRSLQHQTSAHGVIDLKQGSYKAYGQTLKIETGRLIFTGPVDQPDLELKAVRTVQHETVTAFLEVRGPVNKPVLQVKSQPPLPQIEALAYLLTGRSFKSSGTADQTAVAKAALGMGINLALPWIRKLGLEGVAMKTDTTPDTSLSLGKYLTPDLYVGYALSLFNGIGRALVRYQINRFFAVEAGAGASQSVDLFYTIETD